MCHSVNILWEAWSFQVYEHGWVVLCGPVCRHQALEGTKSYLLFLPYRLLDANHRK